MSNFSPYSNFGYLSLIKEATAGTAVTPTGYLRIRSESLLPSFGVQALNEVAGSRERFIRSVPNKVEMSGDVEFLVEPKMIGHFLRSLFGAPATQTLTASYAYRHRFTVTDTPVTYTFDVQPADAPYVHRFFGVMVSKLQFAREDNVIKCTASLMPRRAFIAARVTTAVNSGTTLTVDQTSGLTTSDSILILAKEDGATVVATLTIASIDSETQLTTSTIGVQLDVKDIMVIKRATVTDASYAQDTPFVFLGGTALYTGDQIDNTTEEAKEDISIEFKNDVEARYLAGLDEIDRYPADVLVKGYEASGKFSKFFDSESKLDRLRKNEHFAARVLMQGETALEANVAAKASSIWGASNGFKVEAEATGKAGNDYSVRLQVAAIDTLSATITDKQIVVSLASTTASKNTGTLIAGVIDALSGVAGTADGTGATQFTAAEDVCNLGNRSSGTNVVGRDASEKPYLQFDFASMAIDPYFVNDKEDAIVMEEMPIKAYVDSDASNANRKAWSTQVYLTNSIATYS